MAARRENVNSDNTLNRPEKLFCEHCIELHDHHIEFDDLSTFGEIQKAFKTCKTCGLKQIL